MINENILVVCDNLNQRDCVFDFLKLIGFERSCDNENHESVCIDFESKEFYDFSKEWGVSEGRETYTYQQFMEKYGMTDLKSKIEQVKIEIGYKSLSKMSYDLGFHYNYLSNTLREGLTPETEAKLIAKLDALLEQHKRELTHDFKGKALNKKIDDARMIGESEYKALNDKIVELGKVVEHKNQVLDKRNDLLNISEQNAEKWESDYWVMARENATLTNELNRSKELVQSHFNEIEALNQVIENGKFALDGANSLLESNRKTYVKNIRLIRSRLNKERLWFCVIFILTIAVFIGISAT